MTLLAKDVALNDSLLSDLYAYGFISLFAVQAVVAAVFSILYTKDIIVLRHAEEFPAHRARRRISCVGAFILLIFSLSNIAVILVESIVKDFGRTSSGVFLLSLLFFIPLLLVFALVSFSILALLSMAVAGKFFCLRVTLLLINIILDAGILVIELFIAFVSSNTALRHLRALDNLFVIAFQLALIIVIVVTGVIIRNYFHKKAPYYVSTSLLSSLFRRVFILTIISVSQMVFMGYEAYCDLVGLTVGQIWRAFYHSIEFILSTVLLVMLHSTLYPRSNATQQATSPNSLPLLTESH